MRIKILSLILLLYSVCHLSFADEFTLHGFVAQGAIQADGSNFVNDQGELSLSLTEMGINSSYRLTPALRVAGQAVYLNGGNRYPEGVRLDYLFVDWELQSSFDWRVNLHLGRYKNYHWLYSTTRDVPHTRSSIVLPQSVYFDTFRDVALGSDGAALIVESNNDWGDWQVHWSYGTSPISNEQTRNLLTSTAQGKLEQEFDHQFTFSLQPALSNLHLGATFLDSDFVYTANDTEMFISGEATVQRFMLQFKYLTEQWEFSSELMREKVLFKGLLFDGFFNKAIAEGGYFQSRYHIDADLSLMARIDVFDRDREDRSGSNIVRLSGGTVPGYFGYADQLTIGVQWDLKRNWRLQFEYHKVKGTGRLAPVLSPNTQFNKQAYWDIFAVQLMYWF